MYKLKGTHSIKIILMVSLLLAILFLAVGCDNMLSEMFNKDEVIEGTIEKSIDDISNISTVDVEVDIGDIDISYGIDDFVIKADYTIKSKTKIDMTEIIDQIEIQSIVKDENLKINIVKKDDEFNLWDWINENYKDLDFYVNLDILVPKKTNKFTLYSHLGDINLNCINGEIIAKTDLGDIIADKVRFNGKCFIQSGMGDIECKLGPTINKDCKVNIYTSMGDIIINSNKQNYKTIDTYEKMMSIKETILVDDLCTITAETCMGDLTFK